MINPIMLVFVAEIALVCGLIGLLFGSFLVGAGIGAALALGLSLALTYIQSV
jgi:hypothetical protein